MAFIGILGGSFDPVHFGHLSIGTRAMEEMGLSYILLLPAKVQPFKLGRKMASEEHRLAMLRLVCEDNPDYRVSTVEIDRDDVSYTYDSMVILKEKYKNDKLYFILGTDALMSLDTWYKGPELLRDYSFIIGARPGFDRLTTEQKIQEYRQKYDAEITLLHNHVLDVSSTDIKKKIKSGEDISAYVPSTVKDYINEYRLYR